MNKILTVLLIFVGTIAVQYRSAAQGTMQISLQQAQDYAQENNISIQNSRLDVKSANQKVWETTAIGLPQVSGTASYTNMLDIPTSLIPAEFFGGEAGTFMPVKFGTQHNMKYGITATQIIFSGEYIVGMQASRTYKQMSEQNMQKTEVSTRTNITNTYYMVLIAEENLKILQQSAENTKKLHAEMQEMQKAGFMEDTEVDQLELALLNLENTTTQLTDQVRLAKRMLVFMMGAAEGTQVELTEDLEQVLTAADVEGSLTQEFDVSQNIDYKMMQTQKELNALSMKREVSTGLPTLAAFLSYEKNAMREKFDFFSSDGDWFPTTVVGLQLEVPIFGSGSRKAKISQAHIELKKSENLVSLTQQNLNMQYEQSQAAMQVANEKYKNQQKNLALAEKIYNKTQLKFKEGICSSLEYTQAQNQYLTAQADYYTAIFELLNAKTKIEEMKQ